MLQLVHEIPVSIKIHKTLSQRRGFHFYLAAGFSGEVGPLSGMAVNLVLVDNWLKALKGRLESQVFTTSDESLNGVFLDLYAQAASFLKSCADETSDPSLAEEKTGKVFLASLALHEERGFGFQSFLVPIDLAHEVEFFNTHYLELVPPEGAVRLLKIKSYWRHRSQSDSDYAYESFKLLKPLMVVESEHLMAQLQELPGWRLKCGSTLSRLEIQDLAGQTTIEIRPKVNLTTR